MTEILFVTSSNTTKLKHEANGTLLLATKLLQAGFQTEILRFGQDKNFDKDYQVFIESFTAEILRRSPKCVSFYTLGIFYHIMLRVAREIKKARPEMNIVLGGPQASATAQATMETMEYVDYVCTGEGENTVLPFFEALLRGKKESLAVIPGLYYREEGVVKHNDTEAPLCDLNTLPYWDTRLLAGEEEPDIGSDTYFMPIDAGRGCPFSCTFCNASSFLHRTYRLKSSERIMKDITYYNKEFGIKSFNFSHDAFTTNLKLVNKICDEIIASGLSIKWKCTARINCITKELALKMKQAGMTHIEFGVETGSKRMQQIINKKLDLEHVMETVAFLLENKIHVSLFFMYGFPEETEQDLAETLKMRFAMLDMGVQFASMLFCRFNPTTVLTEKYFDELVFAPGVRTLARDVFGYIEEMQVIRENKALFPFFYHLRTPLRDEYQHLEWFDYLYKEFPHTARYVRKLYGGDDLRFYKDFAVNNSTYLENMDVQSGNFNADAQKIMENTLKDWDVSYIKQLKGLLKFDNTLLRVSRAKGDVQITDTYDFSYLDYRAKRPIEQYSDSSTEILIMKKDGKTTMRILSMK